jgi:hypothetical protein
MKPLLRRMLASNLAGDVVRLRELVLADRWQATV